MQYAATRPTLPSRRSIVAPLVALVVGAGAAVGGYALIDDQNTVQAPGEVVFVDTPGPGAGVRGIDDTANAAALDSAPPKVVIPYLSHGAAPTSDTGGSTTDEAATAAAIGSGSDQGGSVADRTDPHGPAAQLHAH
jgi:hypothetical protein